MRASTIVHDFSARLSSALSASSAAGKLREDLSELNPAQLELVLSASRSTRSS
jgi:hypothetical protein